MTDQERAQVRELVERTCREQGVPITVPPDVARVVAMLVAGRRPSPYRPPDDAASKVGAADGAPLAS